MDYTALMRSRNPEKYEEYSRLMQEGIKNKDNPTIGKAMKIFIDWSIDLHKNHPEVVAGAVKSSSGYTLICHQVQLGVYSRNTSHTAFHLYQI